ncbi:hypothetical protein WK94_04425 [Burkholderia ubonensis]|nr:hypothetical protein WK94_04425 [Burkholderia ubonensis]
MTAGLAAIPVSVRFCHHLVRCRAIAPHAQDPHCRTDVIAGPGHAAIRQRFTPSVAGGLVCSIERVECMHDDRGQYQRMAGIDFGPTEMLLHPPVGIHLVADYAV